MVVKGSTYFARISILVIDQLEERTLMSMKRRDSDMDCSHYAP